MQILNSKQQNKSFRNQVSNLIIKSNIDYYDQLFSSVKNYFKMTKNVINEV